MKYKINFVLGKHEKLYSILTKILTTFVPMYDRVLTDLANPRERRYQPDPYSWYEVRLAFIYFLCILVNFIINYRNLKT